MTTSSKAHTHVRRIAAAVFLALVIGSPLLPIAQAQTQADFWNSTERKFYLHLAQYCDRAQALIRWIDEFDWGNDLDGCGGNVLDPAASWTDVFPAFVPLYANVTGSTAAEMHIFILSRVVDQTSVTATLDVGYGSCSGSAGPEVLTPEKATGFHEFVIPCTFEAKGAADPAARPNLTIQVSATHTYGYGAEGDHASYITLTGVTPAPPAKKVEIFAEGERPLVQLESEDAIVLAELPAEKPAEKSPNVGLVVLLGALGGAVFVHRRRSGGS
jgi:hypothetical protein